MATKALAFTFSFNDLFGSKAPPHTSAKVSVFSVRCSSGNGERPWKNSDARLVLEDGSIWKAKSFGASGTQVGEVVFNTSLTGYQEILTDPSYAGQFVLMTNPHIGNTGINFDDEESTECFLSGLVIRSLSISTSNWRCVKDLGDYLTERNVMGIYDVDTRAITRRLREDGSLIGVLSTDNSKTDEELLQMSKSWDIVGIDLISGVSCKSPYEWVDRTKEEWEFSSSEGPRDTFHVVAYDFGIKHNILRRLASYGCKITVVPSTWPASETLKLNPDGVLFSNGPGDPSAVPYAVETVKNIIGKVPVFGICMGHQLLGQALGGTTYKMKFGHHGGNHPVRNLRTGRVEISSQNHNYAVDPATLPEGVEVTHINLNDSSCAGLAFPAQKIVSLQYHPEAKKIQSFFFSTASGKNLNPVMGDGIAIQSTNNSIKSNKDKKKKKKKNKNRGGSKKKMTHEQVLAFKFVTEWVSLDSPSSFATSSLVDDFGVQKPVGKNGDRVVFDLHCHSKCSDGFLSPSKVVERAHINGVKVLALTDHDTMAGIPEAVESARKYGIKIIPGVEVSTIFYPSGGDTEAEEPVHILAYYSSIGPSKFEELDKFLSNIRDGRYLRAKNMVLKLNKLKMALKWEHVCRIAGSGTAPGRLHVARAMVEAGYVENLKQAFARYLFDGGPAYSKGSEPVVEEAIKMICDTGGVAVLAHPWALKNPVAIIRRLKEAGLHGMEVYKSDGRLAAYSDLADAYGLLKIGGSDYHGRGGHHESELGSVNLPVLVLHDFLKVARPIWCNAIRELLECYAEEPSNTNLETITRFGRTRIFKGGSPLYCGQDLIDHCLPLWLSSQEMENEEFEATKLKLSNVSTSQGGTPVLIET